MKKFQVICGVGSDQQGIVETVSSFLFERGLNIEDSRMAILGGEFAILILVSGADAALDLLQREIGLLEEKSGLKVYSKPTGPRAAEPFIPYRISAVALDHPGIVQAIASAVAAEGINVASLDTQTAPAPITGAPVFNLHMTVEVSPAVPMAKLKAQLTAIGEKEGIDISVEPLIG